MKKEQPKTPEDIKPDLKHDTMEYSAATDGDDAMDTDDATYEEEGITGEELDAIDDDDDSEAAALDAEETDHLADNDTLPEEDWIEDADLDDNAEDS